MPEVDYSVTIGRPVSEVFRTAANFAKAGEFQPDVTETIQSDDKLRIGIIVTQRRKTRLMGWQLDLNADIVDYQPNRLVEYKGVLGRFPITGRLEFSSSGGQTTVREWMNIRMGFLYAIFGPFMRGVMKRRTRNSLESLKKALESGSTRASASAPPTDFHKEL